MLLQFKIKDAATAYLSKSMITAVIDNSSTQGTITVIMNAGASSAFVGRTSDNKKFLEALTTDQE